MSTRSGLLAKSRPQKEEKRRGCLIVRRGRWALKLLPSPRDGRWWCWARHMTMDWWHHLQQGLLWGYNPRYQQGCTWAEPLGEVQPTRLRMGHATGGGPAYKTTPCEAWHRSACAASLREASLMTKENLIGYGRYHSPCKHISCNRSR